MVQPRGNPSECLGRDCIQAGRHSGEAGLCPWPVLRRVTGTVRHHMEPDWGPESLSSESRSEPLADRPVKLIRHEVGTAGSLP